MMGRSTGGRFVANPGTAAVADGRLDVAWENARRFKRELKSMGCRGLGVVRDQSGDGAGRFGFYVVRRKRRPRRLSVLMPGVPWSDLQAASAWAPRLYVDGDSWELAIAIDRAAELLGT